MSSQSAGRVVAVGASAGGVEALTRLVSLLPRDFPAPILVVLHVPAFSPSHLPAILLRAGALQAAHARDREPLVPGRIYVAPPDFHLLAMRDHVRIVRGPHENNARPALDPLFRSVALAFGRRAIAVVLTGTLDDGAAGVVAVSMRGGTVVVQDPKEALYAAMPANAIAARAPDYVATVDEIASVVDRLVREADVEGGGEEMDDEELRLEQSFAAFDLEAVQGSTPGEPAPFSCPTCGGTLWEAPDEAMLRFRCRVGHAFGAETLLHSQAQRVEEALWTALRALEERRSLTLRVADRLRRNGLTRRAERYESSAEEAAASARVLRDALLGQTAEVA
jgi:two-component system chemotaxis response regulator CheB